MKIEEQTELRAKKLLEILMKYQHHGYENVKYLAFVLQSWYDDGYKDAVYKMGKDHDKLYKAE